MYNISFKFNVTLHRILINIRRCNLSALLRRGYVERHMPLARCIFCMAACWTTLITPGNSWQTVENAGKSWKTVEIHGNFHDLPRFSIFSQVFPSRDSLPAAPMLLHVPQKSDRHATRESKATLLGCAKIFII